MDNINVPYVAHESMQARWERANKRLIIALIIAVVLMFASNGAWLWAWMQYDYTSETTETVNVDGTDGIANYVDNGGSVVNGIGTENSCTQKDENAKKWELTRYTQAEVEP